MNTDFCYPKNPDDDPIQQELKAYLLSNALLT